MEQNVDVFSLVISKYSAQDIYENVTFLSRTITTSNVKFF